MFNQTRIYAKISNIGDKSLEKELVAYQRLQKLQGVAVPVCYGLFSVGTIGHMLLVKDMGRPIERFEILSEDQR